MEDFKNERKDQEITQDVKKEGSKQKDITLTIIIVVVAFFVGVSMGIFMMTIYQSIEESTEQELSDTIQSEEESTEQELSDTIQSAEENPEQEVYYEYNYYSSGLADMGHQSFLKDDVIAFYKSGDITDEQMEEFVETYWNIINSSLSNNDISPEIIENYNEAMKKIQLIDYDQYKLRSTGENYRKGLTEYATVKAYVQIVVYYESFIPEEKYNSFVRIVDRKLSNISMDENNIQKVIDYARSLIQEYIGDPDEVIVSTEWRDLTGMPEK